MKWYTFGVSGTNVENCCNRIAIINPLHGTMSFCHIDGWSDVDRTRFVHFLVDDNGRPLTTGASSEPA